MKTPVLSSTYSSEIVAGEGGTATVVAGGTASSFPPVCGNHMNFIEILDSVQALDEYETQPFQGAQREINDLRHATKQFTKTQTLIISSLHHHLERAGTKPHRTDGSMTTLGNSNSSASLRTPYS